MNLTDAGLSTTVVVGHRRPLNLSAGNRAANREVVQALVNLLGGAGSGEIDAVHVNANQANMPATAGATLILAGGAGAGAVGGVINGVTVTDTAAVSDTNSAGLVAAAINASTNALVQGYVRASNVSAQLTLATCTAGSTINLRVDGSVYVFTATAADSGKLGEFSISGNDTADALALCDAINEFPILNQKIRAERVAGAVYLYAMDGSASDKKVTTLVGSGVTINSAFAAAARCHVECPIPGAIGNAITFAASGTGVSVANANTRMVGGQGGLTGTTKRAKAGGV